jgi:hypothetical protein
LSWCSWGNLHIFFHKKIMRHLIFGLATHTAVELPKSSKTSASTWALPHMKCLCAQLFNTTKFLCPGKNHHTFPISNSTKQAVKGLIWCPFLCCNQDFVSDRLIQLDVLYFMPNTKGMIICNWGAKLARDFSSCIQLWKVFSSTVIDLSHVIIICMAPENPIST